MPEATLRETLEAAYVEVEQPSAPASTTPEETGGSTKDTSEPVRSTAPTEKPPADEKPADEPSGGKKRGADGKFLKDEKSETQEPEVKPDQPETTVVDSKPEDAPEPESRPSVRAPESWKPQAREHWSKLPAEVQQEVSRREREITSTLQNTAQQRKLAEHFTESIRPFEAMIRAENRDPVTAARELFATAAMLRTGSPAQKAQLVANMVKNFSIPIDALDAALVGEQIPDEDSKIVQLLEQRLGPVQQFMTEIQSMREQRQQTASSKVQSEIEAFSQDPKNEFFEDVRETMADLMEVASKRGKTLGLQQAYEQAIAMDPDIKKILDDRKAAAAQKKRDASASLPSSPPPQGAPTPGKGTLRDDLEAAFAAVANR